MTKARDTASLVSTQTGIAVTISGDPVILGVGNTETIIINGNGRIGIGTDGGSSLYKLETYSEANDVTSGSIRANNPSTLPASGAYVTVNSGSGTSAAGGGWAAWNHNYATANLAGYVGNIAFSNGKGILLGAASSDQHTKIVGLDYTETARFTSDNKVGIGTTNPGSKLTITDNVSQVGYSTQIPDATSNLGITNTAGDAYLNLLNDDRTTGPVANNGAFIGFNGKYSTLFPASNRTFGAIGAFKENGTAENQQGYLALYSRPSSGGTLERFRITSGGTVGIGTTTSSNYTVAIRGTADNPNPTHGSLYLYGTEFAFIGFNNDNNEGGDGWFIGNRSPQTNATLSLRYGAGPGNSIGSLYLHTTHMVSVGSAVTTGTPNQTFQVMNGGGYFANHLSVGTTGNYQTFSLYGNQWMNGNNYITWNNGDVIVQGLNVASGYGISISSYNATMDRMVPSIVSSGANKSVGIHTTATLSSFGLVVQKENGYVYETGLTGAIYARGSIYSYAGQYLGGLGAMGTNGTTDWNNAMNARSGNGYTLLLGNATNGPTGVGNYYHAINFEYSSKDGSGNMTQLAIPYYGAGYDVYYRTRYAGTWSSWTAV